MKITNDNELIIQNRWRGTLKGTTEQLIYEQQIGG